MSVGSETEAAGFAKPLTDAPERGETPSDWQSQLETFVGRESEMQILRTRIDEARAGKGSLVLVSGEPGIGKTRLLTEAARYAESTGMPAIWGRPGDQSAPSFWPWRQVVRAMAQAGFFASKPSFVADLFLNKSAPKHAPEDRHLLQRSTDYSSAARFQLLDEIAAIIREATTGSPLSIWIDDLHSVDSESIALLEFLASDLDRAALTLVCCYRTEEVCVRPGFDQAVLPIIRNCRPTRIELAGLSPTQVEQIASQLTPNFAPNEQTSQSLYQRTSGNPFFIVETCLYHRQNPQSDQLGAPAATIRSLIRSRLARLPSSTQALLSAAAVLGSEFDIRMVHEILAGKSSIVSEDIEMAIDHGLVRRPSFPKTLHRFAHDLVHESVYLETPSGDRQSLHKLAADCLESRADNTDKGHDQLAHHMYFAGPHVSPEKTFTHLLEAGRRALDNLAYESAVRHFLRAQEVVPGEANLGDQCTLQLLLGEAQTKAGMWTEGRKTFEEALRISRQLCSHQKFAHAAIGMKGMTRGTLPPDLSAIKALREALLLVPDDEFVTKSRLYTALSTALYFDQNRDRAASLASSAVSYAKKSEDPLVLGDAIESQIVAEYRYDRADEMLSHCHELEELGNKTSLPDLVFRSKIFKYTALCQLKDPSASTELETCTNLAESLRHPRYLWQVHLARAALAICRGQVEDATRLYQQTRERGKRFHDPTSLQHFMLAQFNEARLRQRYRPIMTEIEAMVLIAPEYPLPRTGLAFFYAATGDCAKAKFTLAPIVLPDLKAIIPDGFALQALCILADLLRFLGTAEWVDELEERLSPFEDQMAVSGWGTVLDGSIAHFLALIKVAKGDHSAAKRLLAKAIEVNNEAHLPILAARSQVAMAAVFRREGLGDEEITTFEQARATFESAGLPTPSFKELYQGQVSTSVSSAKRQLNLAASCPNRFELNGEYWTITFENRQTRLKDTKGIRHLHSLIRCQGREILSLELVTTGQLPAGRSPLQIERTEPTVDKRTIRECQMRLAEISSELEDLETNGDLGHAERIREEQSKIQSFLESETGLFGTVRQTGSNWERARINVRNAITAAVKRIRQSDESLARHLDHSIRTGRSCMYNPETTTLWEVR